MRVLALWPLRRKLTALLGLGTGLSVAMAAAALLVYQHFTTRSRTENLLRSQAEMIGVSVIAALDFGNTQSATEILATLAPSRTILGAELFDDEGRPFAAYFRDPSLDEPAPLPPLDGIEHAGDRLRLVATIQRAGLASGRLRLTADASAGKEQLLSYALVLLAICAAAAATALAVATLLQRAVSRPLLDLVDVAEGIGRRGDLDRRARVYLPDEIGRLALAFNRMLDTLADREAALRASESRFRAIFDGTFQFIGLLDREGRLIDANPAALRFAGKRSDEVIGRFFWETAWWRHDAAAREHLKASIHRAAEGEFIRFETSHHAANGRVHYIDFSLTPIFDAAGRVTQIIPEGRDITPLKEAVQAREQLEQQLRQAQKLEAIGQLAGGVAHDFNNLLTVIQTNASLVLERPGLHAEDAECLRDLLGAAERAANLTRQLLTFSRKRPAQLAALDLNEVVAGALRLLRRVIGVQVELKTNLHPRTLSIQADPGMMEQVLFNLSLNARDAMPQGGTLTITTRQESLAPEHLAAHPSGRIGDFALLSVEDTGTGMPPEVLARIFEPFFTTKDVGQGTGLGLSTVFGIIQLHRGWIEVNSTVGRGTLFRVYIPLEGTGGTRSTAAAESDAALLRGDASLLLVEDDDAVRERLRGALTSHGYRVTTATRGREALDVWERQGGTFDLLVTDIMMPGTPRGLELIEILQARAPRLRALCISGYAEEMLKTDPARLDRVHFLQKPFTVPDILRAIHRCLAPAGSAARSASGRT